MVVDEQAWRHAVQALENAVGTDEANALIPRFLGEPARRDDITSSEQRLDARIAQVEERLDARITHLEERVDWLGQLVTQRIDAMGAQVTATMRGELNAQVRSMMFGFVGLQATIGGFVIALGRFVL